MKLANATLRKEIEDNVDLHSLIHSSMPMNKRRSELRKIARIVVNHCFTKQDRTDFRDTYNGNTISYMIDHTGIEVSTLICGYGLGTVTGTNNTQFSGGGTNIEWLFWRLLGGAFTDTNLRQSNTVGYHKDFASYKNVFNDLKTVHALTTGAKAVPKPTTATPTSPGSSPGKTPKAITIDANMKGGIDTLLNNATGGRLSDIQSILDTASEAKATITDLKDELANLKKKMSVSPRITASGSSVVDGKTLTYKTVYRNASDIFQMGGQKHKPLDFEIPTLEWTDDSGNVVRHPECPDIDDTYQFRLKHLVKFLSTVMFGNNVWLHGHTGTGKTTFAEQVAARLEFLVMRLNMDSNMDSSDVKGSKDLDVKDGAPITVFTEGILPQAMVRPCWFVLDECDAGRADVLFVIQRALESKGLIITEDGGRLVQPHEHFRFIATANSRGQGDEHGWYQGVRPMNLAFLDRFGAFIEIGYLDKDDEMRMLQTAYPALTDTEVAEMCQFSQEIRKAFMGGEISTTLSPRGLHAMAQYYLHFKNVLGDTQSGCRAAIKDAVETVVIDKAPSDCSQTIQQLASTSFGGW